MNPGEIIGFWLTQDESRYFEADAAFDDLLRQWFGAVHQRALDGMLSDWEESQEGRLALILLLDQMSRNIHRGTPKMFAGDAKALVLANRAIEAGDDAACGDPEVTRWYYMPFMHSEKLSDQDRCVRLCREAGLEETLPFAIEHRNIIARFGRFPHRNAILGRRMGAAEQAFLDGGGFSG
jgi:uncharacterized protein (DUF924 family)